MIMEKVKLLKKEEILKFWQENKILKSMEKPAGKEPVGNFVFMMVRRLLPACHISVIYCRPRKDVIPRYQTMRGKRVARRWGWDCCKVAD